MKHETLSQFIAEQRRDAPGLAAILDAIRVSSMQISALLADGRITDVEAAARDIVRGNVPSEAGLRAVLAAEMPEAESIAEGLEVGDHVLAFDALEGAAELDLDTAVGSLFSVRRATEAASPFLGSGREQVAACYTLYGPATVLVLTVGSGVQGYTLDRKTGDFVSTHPSLTISSAATLFSVNASNPAVCEPPVQRYVDACMGGTEGLRGKVFDMRWTTKFVAEVHRLLVRGGVFLCPNDTRDPAHRARVDLLCRANAVAMIVEQAGGAASTGRGRILDVAATALDDRVAVILGASEEVALLERFHADHDNGLEPKFSSPLFNERSLFPSR